MKLYLPDIGDVLKLTKDWSFVPTIERRNDKLFDLFFPDYEMGYDYRNNSRDFMYHKDVADEYKFIWQAGYDQRPKFTQDFFNNFASKILTEEKMSVTIPAGSELKVDRVYIRKGQSDYSSITFWAQIPRIKKKIRFFVKLSDANNIEFE